MTHHLNLIAEYGLVNVINECTREEYLGSKITKSCIDYIVIRLRKQCYTGSVIRIKLADHYFTSLVIISDKSSAD